jgi:hypothetical protein
LIDLGRPALHADGVTLFADHASANTFHYLPDRPRLRTGADGLPDLVLLKYRLDQALHAALGAGMLSFTVDLGVDDTVLASLQRKAASTFRLSGPAVLRPVGADQGSCMLAIIDRSSLAAAPAPGEAAASPTKSSLVPHIINGTAPSLYGDNAATFFVVLSAEAAALVEGAIRGEGLPAAVIYTLRTTGLRPALRAEITAQWRDVYKFYENRLHGGKLLLATDIGTTVEKLVHDEVIRIKVDELVQAEEQSATWQRAFEEAQRFVLEELFTPTLGQAPPAQDAETGALVTIGNAIKDIAGFFSFTYSLRDVNRNELKTFHYQLSVARAEHLTLSPQGTLSLLLGDGVSPSRVERLIRTVEPAAAAEMTFDVGLAARLEEEGIDRVEVFITYGDKLERVMLDAATPRRQVSIWFKDGLGLAISYRYDVHFVAGGAGLSGVLSSPGRTTEARVLRVDPRELYQRRELRAVAQGLPFDRFPSVIVDVEARDPHKGWEVAHTLQLDAAHPDGSFTVRAQREDIVRFRRRLRYIDSQGRETEVPWDDVDPGIMVVGNPLPDLVDVQILGSARFGTKVRRVIVELRPAGDPARVATRVLTADQPAAAWSWAAPAEGPREYEYRVTVHTVLNEIREGPWLPGPPGKLIVGEGIARLRQVELRLVGKTFAELGILALKVRFSREATASGLPLEEEELLVRDPSQPIKWAYPVDAAASAPYTVQLTYIRSSDGSEDVKAPMTTSDLMLVRALA